MISVAEALNIIRQNTRVIESRPVLLTEATGLILAEDITALYDIPAYPQSSMDGYALRFEERHTPLRIRGEMAAGATEHFVLQKHEAARIFTGAPLPDGADTVLMQEKAIVDGDRLLVNDNDLRQGLFVRPEGSEIKKGETAMTAGSRVTVAATGFLAGIGVDRLTVYPHPRVAVILTGNELQKQGSPLSYGKVYDANSYMLSAALKGAGIRDIRLLETNDDIKNVQRTINTALEHSDIVLITGGVSVGDYDFVVAAAAHCGVDTKFHRIKQKPGKPLFFGMKEQKMVFGLPGNPSSALSCYVLYVLPAIRQMMRVPPVFAATAKLSQTYSKGAALTHFLKARLDDDKVTLLHAQESYRLHSFAQANCLAELEENTENFTEGAQVPVHLLRFEL